MTRPLVPPPAALAPLGAFLLGCGAEPPVPDEPVPLPGPTPFEYPVELWDRGIEGETVLRVRVNTDGAVDSVHVETTSGFMPLDSAALAGAPGLRFEPARLGDEPVEAWVLVPVKFLKDMSVVGIGRVQPPDRPGTAPDGPPDGRP